MAAAETLIVAVEDAGLRPTGPRRIVAELVAAREGAFTAADLAAAAGERSVRVGRATIFRAIELFAALGAIERVDLPDGTHAYVACVVQHHHHVICSACGRSAEIGDLGIGALARDVARRTGYRVDDHRLELFGLCPVCQQAETHT